MAGLLCDQHPADRPAFTVVDAAAGGAATLSYGELAADSHRCARALQGLGVGPGDRVATLMGIAFGGRCAPGETREQTWRPAACFSWPMRSAISLSRANPPRAWPTAATPAPAGQLQAHPPSPVEQHRDQLLVHQW
ncbi:AMP-binding protein [Streptomyces adelaidensis]|uniref:AMP-binding protein n=1 Tax=Streptomyces adelaidensis TaxID=2796465 RepID=UPI001908537E|nr:AMP-binding protein [Streptomyces adelaidensis]